MIRLELLVIASFIYVLPYAKGYLHRSLNLDSQNVISGTNGDTGKEGEVLVNPSFSYVDPTPASNSASESESEGPDERHLNMKFNAFGEHVDVDLKPVRSGLASALTPVWLAQMSRNGNVTFTRAAKNALEYAVKLYQDRKTRSSVAIITSGRGDLHCIGVVFGYRIVVPLGALVILRRRVYRRATADSNAHIVSKISRRRRDDVAAAASAIESKILSTTRSNTSTIYPKLLITTDYNVTFDSTSSVGFYHHLLYILAFFNGVDLIFKQLSAPDVRLHIAGIVVGGSRSASPYLENNRKASGVIDASAALGKIGEFYQTLRDDDFSPGSYDIIVTLTNSHICDAKEEEICSPILGGVSSVEPVCKNDRPEVAAAAILQDNLAFSGIRMAAHELGHILGAEHDGEKDEGTEDCDASDGYLMSKYNESSTVSLKWSNCSLRAFEESLKRSSAECLRNPPKWNEDETPLPSILPGDIVDLHYQCRAFQYYRACAGPENCKSLMCADFFIPLRGGCVAVGVPAAQGSQCGSGMHCLNGECVKK